MNTLNQSVIYMVFCEPSGLSYIGQAKSFKYKNGRPYRYGMTGRWSDHVSQSRRATSLRFTHLHRAIQTFGKEAFVLCELEITNFLEADDLEAEYIKRFNTLVPNGYNAVISGIGCNRKPIPEDIIEYKERRQRYYDEMLERLLEDPNPKDVLITIRHMRCSFISLLFKHPEEPSFPSNAGKINFGGIGTDLEKALEEAEDFVGKIPKVNRIIRSKSLEKQFPQNDER